MKVDIKKKKGIDVYEVYIDSTKSQYWISKQNFLTTVYFLVYKVKRLKRRCEKMNEVTDFLRCELLENSADLILGKK